MIYLDYQATTPIAPEVRGAMLPFLDAQFANPHSPHRAGREAAAVVEVARERIMAALGGAAGRLVFTSGATEAANIAIQSVAASSARRTIVTIATEHPCVRDTARMMAARGFRVIELPVGADGIVDLDAAAATIGPDTALVAAMLVNNEIGVIQPIAALGDLARQAGALFLCDAVQGFGRTALPAEACDMIAISAHKIHGPKGIGALWIRDGVAIAPLVHGGGQEGGLRSGTLAPMLCAGFGVAAQIAAERQAIDGLDAGRLISELRDIAFSAGSACASGSGRTSHVLKAIGLSEAEARSSLRLGFGRYTTGDEIDRATAMILAAAARQENAAGIDLRVAG